MREKLDIFFTYLWNAFANFLIKTGMAVDTSWVEYKEVASK